MSNLARKATTNNQLFLHVLASETLKALLSDVAFGIKERCLVVAERLPDPV